MMNPEIANRPDALFLATRLAKADIFDSQQPAVQKKLQETQNQVKSLQKNTLVEGAGSQVQGQVKPLSAAIEKGKSGTVKDNVDAMNDILKRTGVL